MKKICAILLAAMMLVSLTAVFATTLEAAGSDSTNINISVKQGTESTEIINVEVTWEDLSFEYTTGGRTWKPETHTFEYADGEWNKNEITNALTVKNHSNKALTAKLEIAECTDKAITFTGADTEARDLPTAVGTTRDGADQPTLTWNIGINGAPTINKGSSDMPTIAPVAATLTIAAA